MTVVVVLWPRTLSYGIYLCVDIPVLALVIEMAYPAFGNHACVLNIMYLCWVATQHWIALYQGPM